MIQYFIVYTNTLMTVPFSVALQQNDLGRPLVIEHKCILTNLGK